MQSIQATSVSSSRKVVVLEHGEGQPIWFLDQLLTIKASTRDGAPFGVVEASLPAGSSTPYHRHAGEDEAFFVIDGELTIFVEGVRPLRAKSGAYVHVPRGVAHGFRTDSAVRMLVVTGVEGFIEMVREYGVVAPRRELPPLAPPDLARLGALAEKHRIELLGPLPESI